MWGVRMCARPMGQRYGLDTSRTSTTRWSGVGEGLCPRRGADNAPGRQGRQAAQEPDMDSPMQGVARPDADPDSAIQTRPAHGIELAQATIIAQAIGPDT